MHLHSYLRSAINVITLYDGVIPLAAWLKTYFKKHKKFGSKDRKIVADLCFCYYRLGDAFKQLSVDERLLTAQFLCHEESIFITVLKKDWVEKERLSREQKMNFLAEAPDTIFPVLNEISDEIALENFSLSHLSQPDLFLRVRARKREIVLEKLKNAKAEFFVEGDCIRLPNMTKADEILAIDKDAVIQDKSSQQSLRTLIEAQPKTSFTVWDCCAASGGKSILLHDHFPKAQLTVSDIRESIIHNLRSRFKQAGITSYTSFVTDVSSSNFSLNKKFDVIICDAPCSGSGTWGRTPEQLNFFLGERIAHYAKLQKEITVNAAGQLNPGGYFLYITCSVFKAENEEVVEEILRKTPLKLTRQTYYKGYDAKADTMFTALFSI